MEPDRVHLRTGRSGRRTSPCWVAIVLAVTLVGGCSAQSVTDDADPAEVVFTERVDAEPGDLERQLGEPGEVYGRRATLVAVEQIDAFDEIDAEGYLVLEVSVANVSGAEVERSRGDWTLELPDGRRIQTAAVAGQQQLGTGTLDPGDEVTGKVVFTTGDLQGSFFAVFMPRELRNDTDDRQRIVWGFGVD